MIQLFCRAASRKLAIFDRDDTLIRDVPGLRNISDIEWLPGRIETLVMLSRIDYDIAIATNQSAIAKRMVSIEEVESIHSYIAQKLIDMNVNIVAIAYCPHAGVSNQMGLVMELCRCRKPGPGLLEEIYFSSDQSYTEMYFIGNSISDVNAAKNFRIADIRGVHIEVDDQFKHKVLKELSSDYN